MMETDSECLVAADYCEEHGFDLAAELLRTPIDDIDNSKVDFSVILKAVELCGSWPKAIRKLADIAISASSASLQWLEETVGPRAQRRQRARVTGDLARFIDRDLEFVNKLLWRRRGGYEERGSKHQR